MGKTNHVIKENERKGNVIKRKMNGNEFQIERISEHELQIKGNIIVLDRLEEGSLRILEFDAKGPVYIQHISGVDMVTGATCIGGIKTNILFEKRAVLITEIYCKEGYEELAQTMVDQVEFFVDFYEQFDDLWIMDYVHEKWNLNNGFCPMHIS